MTLMATTTTASIVPGYSLEQWNADQQAQWDARQRSMMNPQEFPNGLICPQDGGRLYDTGQKFLPTLASPAKLRVKCMNVNCNFRGERLERVNRIQD